MLHCPKTLIISAIAVSLAACSPSSDTSTPTESAVPSSSPASSSSPQPANSAASVAIPGVNNIAEVTFKPASKNLSGFVDAVNRSNAPRIEVRKAAPINVTGWAILADQGRIPDNVIVTYGEDNSLVAVAPVNLARPDVVRTLKNPAYERSGWNTTFNSSTLPADSGVLKAWVYNSTTKEATQLTPTRQVVVTE